MLPVTDNPLVIRTDFDDETAWQTLCKAVCATVQDGADQFYAYVDFVDDNKYQGLSKQRLLKLVSDPYNHSFLFIADRLTLTHPEFPILVVDLYASRGREFRALPTQVQAIQNNLSIANMDFADFAEAVDADSIFRGFSLAQ